jgi:hypothetical protein
LCLLGGAILTVVVLVLVLPGIVRGPSSPSAGPTCPTVRRYTIEERGDLLDASGRLIGHVVPGDVVVSERVDHGPYRSRRKVTVVTTGKVGYVDPAKLNFQAVVCRTAS